MNYQLRLVKGEAAAFFLEEWAPGGVEIAPDVVGLFDALRSDEREFAEQLETYGLEPVSFNLTQLVKVGLAEHWVWHAVRWANERESSALSEAVRRIERLLGAGIREDRERQIQLLKLLQAAARREGPPARIEGVFPRPSGRRDRIYVYATGIVAYDRTPHPLPFLAEVAAAT